MATLKQFFLSVPCSLVVTCWERADLLALLCGMCFCVYVIFPCDVPGQVWYLIVSIPDICLLLYFDYQHHMIRLGHRNLSQFFWRKSRRVSVNIDKDCNASCYLGYPVWLIKTAQNLNFISKTIHVVSWLQEKLVCLMIPTFWSYVEQVPWNNQEQLRF